MLFDYSCWNLFEFLFWSTVLMKWELFPRHWNPGEEGREGFDQIDKAPPTLMRTAGFVRQEEWLEFFFFIVFHLIFFSTLADGWYFEQLEAHRKYSFRQKKKSTRFNFISLSPKSSLHCWSFMHFCELWLCNCCHFLEMTICSQTPKINLKVLCVGFILFHYSYEFICYWSCRKKGNLLTFKTENV